MSLIFSANIIQKPNQLVFTPKSSVYYMLIGDELRQYSINIKTTAVSLSRQVPLSIKLKSLFKLKEVFQYIVGIFPYRNEGLILCTDQYIFLLPYEAKSCDLDFSKAKLIYTLEETGKIQEFGIDRVIGEDYNFIGLNIIHKDQSIIKLLKMESHSISQEQVIYTGSHSQLLQLSQCGTFVCFVSKFLKVHLYSIDLKEERIIDFIEFKQDRDPELSMSIEYFKNYLNYHVKSICFHPSDLYLAIGDSAGKIRRFYLTNQKDFESPAPTIKSDHWHSNPINSLCHLGIDGSLLYSGGHEGVLVSWSAHHLNDGPKFLPRLGGPICQIYSSNCSSYLILILADGRLVLLDVNKITHSGSFVNIHEDSSKYSRVITFIDFGCALKKGSNSSMVLQYVNGLYLPKDINTVKTNKSHFLKKDLVLLNTSGKTIQLFNIHDRSSIFDFISLPYDYASQFAPSAYHEDFCMTPKIDKFKTIPLLQSGHLLTILTTKLQLNKIDVLYSIHFYFSSTLITSIDLDNGDIVDEINICEYSENQINFSALIQSDIDSGSKYLFTRPIDLSRFNIDFKENISGFKSRQFLHNLSLLIKSNIRYFSYRSIVFHSAMMNSATTATLLSIDEKLRIDYTNDEINGHTVTSIIEHIPLKNTNNESKIISKMNGNSYLTEKGVFCKIIDDDILSISLTDNCEDNDSFPSSITPVNSKCDLVLFQTKLYLVKMKKSSSLSIRGVCDLNIHSLCLVNGESVLVLTNTGFFVKFNSIDELFSTETTTSFISTYKEIQHKTNLEVEEVGNTLKMPESELKTQGVLHEYITENRVVSNFSEKLSRMPKANLKDLIKIVS